MNPEAIFTPLPERSPSIRLAATGIRIGSPTLGSPKVRTTPASTEPIPPAGPSPTQD